MDIKLKKYRIIRLLITIVLLAVIVGVNYFAFGKMAEYAASKIPDGAGYDELNMEELKVYYQGCYVLYIQQMKTDGISISDIFSIEEEEQGNFSLDQWEYEFNQLKSYIDYYMELNGEVSTNTEKNLDSLLHKNFTDDEELENLKSFYEYYFMISFDENGKLQVEVENEGDLKKDTLIKGIQELQESDIIFDSFYVENQEQREQLKSNMKKWLQNVTVIYGVPKDSGISFVIREENMKFFQWIGLAGYLVCMVMLFLLMILMNRSSVRKNPKETAGKRKIYLPETGIVGIVLLCILFQLYVHVLKNAAYRIHDYGVDWYTLKDSISLKIIYMLIVVSLLGYGTVLCFWPIITYGIKMYIREYSFFYHIMPSWKKRWELFRKKIQNIDFNNRPVKLIMWIAGINFILLAFICLMGVWGIIFLVFYTALLIWLMMEWYGAEQKNYNMLLGEMKKIAGGKLGSFENEDMGMFNPMKEELREIHDGFKTAVEEEVKSQRMKTELITNVSHDLKTPLTGIMTYIELLKNPDITQNVRADYVRTLEAKALRLKVLIEDLFEVSRAESENISLDWMEVDLVNLVKQAAVEHLPQMEKKGLEIRWNVPERELIWLDSQKTYRIFENLFVNVHKYAMERSRVYVDIIEEDDKVKVVIKNISAEELNIAPDELTERFVRGDRSRNSEGSGLGLAIARSFTELQGGQFYIEVDGDLFKVILVWNRKNA